MNKDTKETLDTIARLLEKNAVSPNEALLAAYQLGNFDGQMKMALVGASTAEKLLEAA